MKTFKYIYYFLILLLSISCNKPNRKHNGKIDTKIIIGKYDNGQIRSIGTFKGFLIDGMALNFKKRGSIQNISFLKNDELEGPLIFYDSSNRITNIRMYKKNLLHGYSLYYDSIKNLIKSELFNNDELIEVIHYFPEKKKKKSYYIYKNKRIAYISYYYPEGLLKEYLVFNIHDSMNYYIGKSFYKNGSIKTQFKGFKEMQYYTNYFLDSQSHSIGKVYRYFNYKLTLNKDSILFEPYLKTRSDDIKNYTIYCTYLANGKQIDSQNGNDNNNVFLFKTLPHNLITLKYKICDKFGCTEIEINFHDEIKKSQVIYH